MLSYFHGKLYQSVFTYTSFYKYTRALVFHKNQQELYTFNTFQKGSNFYTKLMLESSRETHFNIKIIKFIYVAQHEDFNCKYGGVSMFDIILGHMEETRSDCTARVDDQFNLQPFNSQNNKTMIVIYSYHHYSNLSFSINVSVTDCYAVKINLCDMSLVCGASAKFCSAFLYNKSISIKGEKISRGNFKVTFQPIGENCVTVLIEAHPFFYLMPFPNLHRKKQLLCNVKFHIEVEKGFYAYQYDISGYLSNIDSIWGQHQIFYAHGTPYKYDALHNITVIHWTNGTTEMLKNLNEKNKDVFIKLKGHKGYNVAFKANFLEKLPSSRDSVYFNLFLTKWISWVNFYFIKANISLENKNKIMLSSINQFRYRPNKVGDRILRISIRKEDFEENPVEIRLIIKTQVNNFMFVMRYCNCSLLLRR